MQITNHAQDQSIYRMVLDFLPFVLDDCLEVFNETVTAFDVSLNTITIAGNFTPHMWVNQVQTVVETPKTLTVRSFEYDSGSDTTIVTYASLVTGDVVIGNKLDIQGNYNEQLISRYIYRTMVILNSCLGKAEADVGDETKYSMTEKQVVAYLVAYYILFRQTLINSQGDANKQGNVPTPPVPPIEFVSSAKSGEVSTNWSLLKISDTALASLDTEKMLNLFKNQAVCIGRGLGCNIEICPDGTVTCSCAVSENGSPIIENPFIVARRSNRCGPVWGRSSRRRRKR